MHDLLSLTFIISQQSLDKASEMNQGDASSAYMLIMRNAGVNSSTLSPL